MRGCYLGPCPASSFACKLSGRGAKVACAHEREEAGQHEWLAPASGAEAAWKEVEGIVCVCVRAIVKKRQEGSSEGI